MPTTTRPKPLYQRGSYRLYQRAGRRNLEIVWYDNERGRERSASAGTADRIAAEQALDRLFLESTEGQGFCPTCGQAIKGGESPFLTAVIADFLTTANEKPSFDAIRARLTHVTAFVAQDNPAIRLPQVDEGWAKRFREWMIPQPIVSKLGKTRKRSLGTVENSLLQAAAAINWHYGRTHDKTRAAFKPIPTRDINRSPIYRADATTLAAMFQYAMTPNKKRENLLRFLRAAVATWGRPDAVHDISADPARRQWFRDAKALALNPHGRRQTRKYRATIPVARQFAPYLDEADGFYIPVASVKSAWEAMEIDLGLPRDGESGMKLIRRSVAHLARGIIGEEHWRQGEIMLGHHKTSVSDIYALPNPANLGLALRATEQIIDEIEALAPGAFYRDFTALGGNVASIGRAKK